MFVSPVVGLLWASCDGRRDVAIPKLTAWPVDRFFRRAQSCRQRCTVSVTAQRRPEDDGIIAILAYSYEKFLSEPTDIHVAFG